MTLKKKHYPAIIEKCEEGFCIFFPDINGCTSGGKTLDETIDGASEALRFCIDDMIKEKIKIPEPTPMEKLKIDDDIEIHLVTTVPVTISG